MSPSLLDKLQRMLGRQPAPAQDWESGVPEEILFWDSYLGAVDGPFVDERRERLDPTTPLQEWAVAHLPPGRSHYRILDVGAGPVTCLGKQHAGFSFEIVAVDPLAADYDRLLAKHGIEPPVRTQSCAAEELTEAFAPASFDFVNARNCIDHSRDALLAMRQMVAVVKPGCPVLLHHSIDEAKKQGYHGMHKWNFYTQDGAFWVSRLDSHGKPIATNVDELLRSEATVTTRVYDGVWMHNILTRRA